MRIRGGPVPLLSVIIPFYGDPTDTLALLAELESQGIPDSVEIIVSDDCSPISFPSHQGVTVVRRSSNGGFGSNVNTAVAVARGEWVLILNSDLTPPENFLVRMIQAAQEEGAALLSPHIVGHRGESQWVGRKFPLTRHHMWEWFTPAARLRSTVFWHAMVGHDVTCVGGKRAEPDWLMGACMMLRRQDFNAVGGMDERFFMNSEEIDLQRRLAERGTKRVFRGDIVVEHLGGGSSGASAQRRQWVLDSRFIYNAKWGQGQHLALALRLTSYANFFFNLIRFIRNKAVTPRAGLREELAFIKRAEHKK